MALGIYVHIPFCRAKCKYCDFNSYPGMELWKAPYVDALCREIQNSSVGGTVDTVYFGGGTPTVLGPEQLIRILEALRKRFVLTQDCEITAECNPATMGYEGFRKLRSAGFNRLSIGLQSSDDAMLRSLGRIHTFREFGDCFASARKAGFSNLSLDLIYGLPGQTQKGWTETLEKALDFHPEHISCYALKIEEGTPFAQMNLELPNDDEVREMYDFCVDKLEAEGLKRYEISNFARPEYESRHNCKYWLCDDFLGFGAGAYSCAENCRWDNFRDVAQYCRAVNEKNSAAAEMIPLTAEDQMSEFCFLGLRMVRGIDTDEFERRFGRRIEAVYGRALEKNFKRGTLRTAEGRIFIPSEWLYVSNGILVDFV